MTGRIRKRTLKGSSESSFGSGSAKRIGRASGSSRSAMARARARKRASGSGAGNRARRLGTAGRADAAANSRSGIVASAISALLAEQHPVPDVEACQIPTTKNTRRDWTKEAVGKAVSMVKKTGHKLRTRSSQMFGERGEKHHIKRGSGLSGQS